MFKRMACFCLSLCLLLQSQLGFSLEGRQILASTKEKAANVVNWVKTNPGKVLIGVLASAAVVGGSYYVLKENEIEKDGKTYRWRRIWGWHPSKKAYVKRFGAFGKDKPDYEGPVKKYLQDGFGTQFWASGAKYVGEYRDGKVHGKGTFTWAIGDKYVGEYRDDKRHGKGSYTLPNGVKYEGEYQDGKRHGEGTLTFADGRSEKVKYKNGVKVEN